MLCYAAHERVSAPKQEKRTHGQYERNAQEGTLMKRPFRSFRFPNLRGQASAHYAIIAGCPISPICSICSSLARIAQPRAHLHQRLPQLVQPATIGAAAPVVIYGRVFDDFLIAGR